MKTSMKLIGHLQVLDEPLSSLYADMDTGKYFLFVRVYEDTDDDTYVLSEVRPSSVLNYMNGVIGLRSMFENTHTYYYRHTNRKELCSSDMQPLAIEQVRIKLECDGLEDAFDKTLAYRSVSLKHYLINL